MALRDGPHHVCEQCGEISDPSEVDCARRIIVCTACGHEHGHVPLPPLLFLTGPNGGGKTTVYRHLVGSVQEAVLIDGDFLWGMDAAHDDPATDYRLFRTRVFALGLRLASNGRPVVIEGTTLPWQYEQLPARLLVSHTSYLALVCDDDELVRRLRARPAWRRSRQESAIEGMLRMNRAFKTEGPSWSPGVSLLDTTGRTVDETATSVAEWIHGEAVRWSSPSPSS